MWLPGDAEYDKLLNDLGDPLKPPEELDPADDSNLSRARQFGRNLIRGGDDLKNFGVDLAKSTKNVQQGMDLPDPADYDALILKPEVPVSQQQPPPPGPAADDIIGNSVLMGAVLFEAGTRVFNRDRRRS